MDIEIVCYLFLYELEVNCKKLLHVEAFGVLCRNSLQWPSFTKSNKVHDVSGHPVNMQQNHSLAVLPEIQERNWLTQLSLHRTISGLGTDNNESIIGLL
jgi:hypothetical protein